MNEIKTFIITTLVVLGLFLAFQELGAQVRTFTSLQLASGPDSGECLTTDGVNNTWGSSCGGSFPFTVQSWGVSTTTTIGLLNGFLSNASSTITASTTINGDFTLTGLFNFGGVSGNSWDDFCVAITGGSGLCDGNDASGGLGGSIATSSAETSGRVPFWTSTAGTPATLSGGVAGFTWNDTLAKLTVTNASTTNLSITGLTSALLSADASGIIGEYAGTSCTNQVLESLSALGVGTCVSIESEQLGDDDWGELTVASGVVTVDDNVIESEHLGDDDWGDITISSNVASVEDDSHAHTGASLSGIDISDDTNATSGNGVTVNGDTFDFDCSDVSDSDADDGITCATEDIQVDKTDNFTWTGLHSFTQATSTNFFSSLFNANTLRVGQTATTTIDAEGDLALPSAGTFTIDSQLFDSLTDDATLDNNSGDLRVVDVTCTDCLSTTEIDSTVAISARNLTVAGTANQITSSAGAQDLSADRTWTLSIPTDFRVASTTITGQTLLDNLLFSRATGTSATTTNIFSTTASSTNLFSQVFTFGNSILSLLANTITAGANAILDFGSAISLKIPTNSAPVFNAEGQIALDNTSDNLLFSTSTVATSGVVIGGATTTLYAFTVASTSADFVSGGIIEMPSHFLAQVATAIICDADAGTSVVINLSDGTNDTNTVTCTTTETQFALTSNQSFTAYEDIRLEIGTITGTVDRLSIRVIGYKTSD